MACFLSVPGARVRPPCEIPLFSRPAAVAAGSSQRPVDPREAVLLPDQPTLARDERSQQCGEAEGPVACVVPLRSGRGRRGGFGLDRLGIASFQAEAPREAPGQARRE
jgi:hypothetical protein